MASFTDDSRMLGNFNPYVAQLPVDAMVSVGLQKQQEYNQGVQQTQQAIDSVANLPVIKKEQKDYLSQRIGQLQTSVSKVVGQDFSNPQLVNQIQGLTGQIAKDPIIQSAVADTARVQSEDGKMADAQKAGKSDIANEWDYQNSRQKWLNDGDVKSQFTGSYTPYKDVKATLLKGINEGVKPEEQLQDLPFEMENGQLKLVNGAPVPNKVMIEKMTKGITPERIQAAINTLSPDDFNQLSINGRYQYRGIDKEGLKSITHASYQDRINKSNDILQGLAVQKLVNTTDQAYQQNLDDQIKAQSLHRDFLTQQYPQDIQALDRDPEGFKGQLYTQNWNSNMTHELSYMNNSLTYKDNPYRKAYHDDATAARDAARLQLETQKFNYEQGKDAANFKLEGFKAETERMKALKESGKTKNKNGDVVDTLGDLAAPVEQPIDRNTAPVITINDFNKKTADQTAALEGAKRQLILNTPELTQFLDPKIPTGPGTSLELHYKDAASQAAAETAVNQLLDDEAKGKTVSPAVTEFANKNREIKNSVADRNYTAAKIAANANQVFNPSSVYSPIGGINVKTPVPGFENMHISPEELGEFVNKLEGAYKKESTGNNSQFGAGASQIDVLDNEKAKNLFTSPKERLMYQIALGNQEGTNTTPSQKLIAQKIDQARQLKTANQDKVNQRNDYLNKQANAITEADVPADFPINASKPEEVQPLRNFVGRLIARYTKGGNTKIDENNDVGDVASLLKAEHPEFALSALGNDRYGFTISNSSLGTKSVTIPINKKDVQDQFPGSDVDQFANIKAQLALSKNIGRATTDIRNQGEVTGHVLKNAALNAYAVRYHVEQPSTDGKYQVRLYIRDKGKDGDPAGGKSGIVYPLPVLIGENGLAHFMANFSDEDVQRLLQK